MKLEVYSNVFWNPLRHICERSALHSGVEVHSTCVSFTHSWLSAAAGLESAIHHSTFSSRTHGNSS